MPRGILLGLLTLIVCAFLTLFLNAGIAPGAQEVGLSDEPLLLGFRTIFGDGIGTKVLALLAVAGLIASFHTIIYAYGRNIYSLSRAGYFPHWLSVTTHRSQTPHIALVVGAIIGYIVALVIHFAPQGNPVGAVLLNMAVFGAVIAYIMQMAAFVLLRRRLPHIRRPYVSRSGTMGAIVAGAIAAVTLVFLFINTDYRLGVYGCAVWFLAGVAYFGLYGRKTLVYSPEEEFAVRELAKSDSATSTVIESEGI